MHAFVDPRSCPSPASKPHREPTADPEALSELLQLCRDGRLYDIEQWIRDGRSLQADPEVAPRQRRAASALKIALEDGNQALALLLLCNGYDPNLEPTSPLDLALSERRWDLLDLLLDWGADPHQADPDEVFGTYRSDLFRRFRDMGVDLTADHALAEALAYHTSNKPLFGFAKREAETDPRVQRELTIALAHHASEGNAKGVALCLWAGADPHAPVPSLRFAFGHLEDDDDEDGFQGFTAVREACSYGDGKILERLGPDPALDDFDDLYLAASSPEVIRLLAQRALPTNVGSIICRRLAWGFFDHGRERWRTVDVLKCVFEVGGRWHAATKDSIAAVRQELIRVPDCTLIDVMKLLTQSDHCSPDILKELARTPAIRRRLKEVGFMPPDPEEATRRFRRPPHHGRPGPKRC